MLQPKSPAKPINKPNAVGIIASAKSQRFCVSAVTAKSEIAMDNSASDKSN